MTSEGSSDNPTGTALPLLQERYELGERLAEGTFFRTHRGRDIQSSRPVAIKVLRPEFANDEAFCERLLSEARSASQLKDAHVAQVYDAWRERGTIVIVTEWVPGINLKDRIRRVAPFPMAVALDIILACTQALRHAHDSGVIHGDVRPDNIIITPDGRVKLTDFGVGMSSAASTRVQLNALPRAVYYQAPEVVEGRMPNARTDIYSLGCILYEMLSGVVPFDGETPMAVAAKHLHAPPPSLKTANPAVPNAVDGIALKCMQKDPAARYASVGQLISDVEAVREAMRSDRPLDWSPMQAQPAATPENEPVAKSRKPVTAPASPSRTRAERRQEYHEDSGPSAKLLIAVAMLAVVMAALFFGAFRAITSTPNQVTVPDGLVGVSEAQAEAALQHAGLKWEVHNQFTEKYPQGTVYQVMPASGTDLRAGKSVQLFVSEGTEPAHVPDVTGKKLDDARKTIQAAKLSVGTINEEFSEVVDKGMVINQAPVGGAEAAKQSAVTMTVSKGPDPQYQTQSEPQNNGNDNGNTTDQTPTNPGTTDNTNGGPAPDNGGNPAVTPPSVPSPDLPARDHEVNIHIPRGGNGPQHVRIVVKNEDGSEQNAYEADHEPGEDVSQTVTTFGARGKCEIRVFINGKSVSRQKV